MEPIMKPIIISEEKVIEIAMCPHPDLVTYIEPYYDGVHMTRQVARMVTVCPDCYGIVSFQYRSFVPDLEVDNG